MLLQMLLLNGINALLHPTTHCYQRYQLISFSINQRERRRKSLEKIEIAKKRGNSQSWHHWLKPPIRSRVTNQSVTLYYCYDENELYQYNCTRVGDRNNCNQLCDEKWNTRHPLNHKKIYNLRNSKITPCFTPK